MGLTISPGAEPGPERQGEGSPRTGAWKPREAVAQADAWGAGGGIEGILKEQYRDFKPKFAVEKLATKERGKVRDEKLRQIMIGAGLWRVHRRKTEVHQWRERKAFCGEMVQHPLF